MLTKQIIGQVKKEGKRLALTVDAYLGGDLTELVTQYDWTAGNFKCGNLPVVI